MSYKNKKYLAFIIGLVISLIGFHYNFGLGGGLLFFTGLLTGRFDTLGQLNERLKRK